MQSNVFLVFFAKVDLQKIGARFWSPDGGTRSHTLEMTDCFWATRTYELPAAAARICLSKCINQPDTGIPQTPTKVQRQINI